VENLTESREGVGAQHVLGHTRTALHTLVGALLAHWLATEQGRQTHVAQRAGARLAGAADWALGADRLAVHLARLEAHTALVGAHLTHRLGADGSRDAGVGVRHRALGAAWALHEARLGVVHGRTLGGLGQVLALGRHVDDAALGVQELGGGFGDGWATTRHLYY